MANVKIDFNAALDCIDFSGLEDAARKCRDVADRMDDYADELPPKGEHASWLALGAARVPTPRPRPRWPPRRRRSCGAGASSYRSVAREIEDFSSAASEADAWVAKRIGRVADSPGRGPLLLGQGRLRVPRGPELCPGRLRRCDLPQERVQLGGHAQGGAGPRPDEGLRLLQAGGGAVCARHRPERGLGHAGGHRRRGTLPGERVYRLPDGGAHRLCGAGQRARRVCHDLLLRAGPVPQQHRARPRALPQPGLEPQRLVQAEHHQPRAAELLRGLWARRGPCRHRPPPSAASARSRRTAR